VFRSFVEIWRDDERGVLWGWLSTSQIISLPSSSAASTCWFATGQMPGQQRKPPHEAHALFHRLGAHAFPVHSYGFMIAIGLVVGVAISLRRGRSVGLDTGATLDLTFYSVLVGLVGARLLYVLMHAGEYARLCKGVGLPRSPGQKLFDCTAPLRFWQGGLVFLGGAVSPPW